MSTSFDGLISKVKECGQKTVSVAVAQDSAVLEAVRAAKDRGIAGVIDPASAYFCKHPRTQMTDDLAQIEVERFIKAA